MREQADTADPTPPPDRPGCLMIAAGTALVLIGIPMLVCPGPGGAVIASGVGMIAVGLGLRRRSGD